MKTQTLIALKIFLALTLVTGIIYPLFITGISQLFFKHKANGSMIVRNGVIIGSELIGQKFDSTIYFWSRPSATDYNPLPSGGSNYGPTNEKIKKQMQERRTNFVTANMLKDSSVVPIEMLTASASGLDPDISPEAAFMQVGRIVKARNLNNEQKERIINLIKQETKRPQFTVLGEARVNVFILNWEIDKIKQ